MWMPNVLSSDESRCQPIQWQMLLSPTRDYENLRWGLKFEPASLCTHPWIGRSLSGVANRAFSLPYPPKSRWICPHLYMLNGVSSINLLGTQSRSYEVQAWQPSNAQKHPRSAVVGLTSMQLCQVVLHQVKMTVCGWLRLVEWSIALELLTIGQTLLGWESAERSFGLNEQLWCHVRRNGILWMLPFTPLVVCVSHILWRLVGCRADFLQIFCCWKKPGANEIRPLGPKVLRWTLTRSPWPLAPGGYSVRCRLLKAAETEWGPTPDRLFGMPQIFPLISCAFLRDSGLPIVKRQNPEEKSAENLRKNL